MVADGIDTAAAFGQGNVGFFCYQQGSFIAAIGEFCDDAGGNDAGVAIFEEESVRTAFARGVDAVARV